MRCLIAQGGRGDSDILYIRRLGSFFGFKILNFNIFFVYLEKSIIFGYGDFVDIFWRHHKIGLYLGVISMHFRVFS